MVWLTSISIGSKGMKERDVSLNKVQHIDTCDSIYKPASLPNPDIQHSTLRGSSYMK